MTTFVRKTYFSGAGRVYDADDGGLAGIVRQLAQSIAKVAASSVTALTDNSGGPASNGVIPLVPAVVNASTPAAVAATGAFTVTGGTASAGVNKVSAILVNGVDVLGASVDWATDNATTATALAAQITSYSSTPEYTATALGAVVTITGTTAAGAGANGFVVAPTVAGNVTVGSIVAMHGGVTAPGAQKAALEAALVTVRDGLAEIAAKCTTINGKVPALTASITDNSGGATADGTIGAITQVLTAVSTSFASAAGFRAALTTYTAAIATLAVEVNKLAVATGQTPLVDSSGGVPAYTNTVSAVSVTTGTATSGADVTDANAGVTITNANAILVAMADAVKEMATKLNAIVSASSGYLVASVIAV